MRVASQLVAPYSALSRNQSATTRVAIFTSAAPHRQALGSQAVDMDRRGRKPARHKPVDALVDAALLLRVEDGRIAQRFAHDTSLLFADKGETLMRTRSFARRKPMHCLSVACNCIIPSQYYMVFRQEIGLHFCPLYATAMITCREPT